MIVHIKKTIPVPADFAWQKLGREFTEIANFFSQVDVSRPISKQEMPDGYAEISDAPALGRYTESRVVHATEVLTEYSETDRRFVFDAVDVPAFLLSKSQNTTWVRHIDDKSCEVQIKVEMKFRHIFNVLSPLLKKRMTKLFETLIQDLGAVDVHLV